MIAFFRAPLPWPGERFDESLGYSSGKGKDTDLFKNPSRWGDRLSPQKDRCDGHLIPLAPWGREVNAER
jgi:hypothetical protein